MAAKRNPEKQLEKMRKEVLILRRGSETFGEEVVLNAVLYAVQEALKAYKTKGASWR